MLVPRCYSSHLLPASAKIVCQNRCLQHRITSILDLHRTLATKSERSCTLAHVARRIGRHARGSQWQRRASPQLDGAIEPVPPGGSRAELEPREVEYVHAELDEEKTQDKTGAWQKLLDALLAHGIDGMGVNASAEDLAEKYANNRSYESVEERVDALIRTEAAKSFAAGFISGVGGVWTLPVAVPAAVYANWVLQMRVAGAVARLYGHNLASPHVRTLCLLCLLGDSAWGVLKSMGVRAMEQAASRAIQGIPTVALMKLNRVVGTKLVVKCGESGAIKLQRAVPIIGGMVAGSFDAGACVVVGRVAARMFSPDSLDLKQIDWVDTLDVDDFKVVS